MGVVPFFVGWAYSTIMTRGAKTSDANLVWRNAMKAMRSATVMIVLGLAGVVAAQEGSKLASRYGVEYLAERYPQKTPQEALQSVVRAIENKKIEYLVAHLADPDYVDRTINEYKAAAKGGDEAKAILAFERLVKETEQYYIEDPSVLRELRR